MKLPSVGEIMIPLENYPHIPYWFTLRQAMAELENAELDIGDRKSLPRAALVFDEKYHFLGMIGRRDILRGLEPQFLVEKPLEDRKRLFDTKAEPDQPRVSFDKIMAEVRERSSRPVSDVMIATKEVAYYDDHIVKVIYEMNASRLSLLPVLKEGRVVGVIRSVDVFHEFAKLLL